MRVGLGDIETFLKFNKGSMKRKYFLLYPMGSMGESIGIDLAASSTSKGPQAKTTESVDSINVTHCSIQLG